MTAIRDLDFAVVIDLIERATDKQTGTSLDPLINGELKRTPRDARVGLLRGSIINAAMQYARSADELVISCPLMRALVRVQRHPLAPKVFFERKLRDVNVAPIFETLVAEHPELTWSIPDIEDDLIEAVRVAGGDHEVELKRQSWTMHWGPAIYPVFALRTFATLCKLGDLDLDEHERATHEAAIEHYERTKTIKPSALVKKKDS